MNMYDKIKTLRIKRGLSQDELASLTGYTHRSSIGKIENGQVDLPQSKIVLFADALNITPQELMGLDNQELTEIPMDNFVCDDYFPLRYCTNLSAGSFDELLDSEPNAIVYVPISFQNKMKRLIAFKVNGTSMDNIIEDGSIVVVEQTDIKHKDGTVVVAYCDGLTTVKRIYTKEDCLVLMPDSKDKSHMPIMITEEKQVYIIGKVIWHMNGEDISKYY